MNNYQFHSIQNENYISNIPKQRRFVYYIYKSRWFAVINRFCLLIKLLTTLLLGGCDMCFPALGDLYSVCKLL
jgi:hypothetical protein